MENMYERINENTVTAHPSITDTRYWTESDTLQTKTVAQRINVEQRVCLCVSCAHNEQIQRRRRGFEQRAGEYRRDKLNRAHLLQQICCKYERRNEERLSRPIRTPRAYSVTTPNTTTIKDDYQPLVRHFSNMYDFKRHYRRNSKLIMEF